MLLSGDTVDMWRFVARGSVAQFVSGAEHLLCGVERALYDQGQMNLTRDESNAYDREQ